MNILKFYIFLISCFNIDCFQCPIHCFCYKWMNMLRTDCVKKNLYNTFVSFSHETEVLDLSYNVISRLHGNEFQDANLRRLKDLRISHNRLHTVDKLTFNGLEYLENLDLSYNSIEYLVPAMFKYNPNLKVFNVSNNPLSLKMDATLLLSAPSLQVLNLAHCNLEIVGLRLFLNLEQLQILNVSSNYFQEIHPETLEALKDLKYLDISGNDLTCNDKSRLLLQWLINRKIQFPPFCQTKSQKMLTALIQSKETNSLHQPQQRNFNNDWNMTQPERQESESVFENVIQFFQTIPSFYSILFGIQVGIFVGALSTYFCMRKINRLPPVPLRTTSRNVNATRTSLIERSSRFINNDPDNLTFALIPLNTPPGTPPSPYHSRLTFSSNFSIRTT